MTERRLGRAFWSRQRVLLTGAGGFLGSHVREALESVKPASLSAPGSREYDLRDRIAVDRLMREIKPTLVIHLAAVCGGIGANQKNPGRFFYDNALMGLHMMDSARLHQVAKYVQIGTVCAYPKTPPRIPFREDDLWEGYPEETNAPYGLAKKMLLVQAQAYRQQYGFNAIYLLPANLYGPRDHFDLENSHVIPALIRKIADAQAKGESSIELWGDGKPTREFLFAADAARGILLAAEHYDSPEPINLGSGESVRIRDLAARIALLMQYKGKLIWDPSRPNGQPKRALDVSRARKAFGFRSQTPLMKGLQSTIAWYQSFRQPDGNAVAFAPERSIPPKKEVLHHPGTGETLAIVIRSGFSGKKYNFFTPHDYGIQMGLNLYAAGERIQPHAHPPIDRHLRTTQECLVIRKGHLRLYLFDANRHSVTETDLHQGDIVLLVAGGHGFDVFQDTEILEVKQGPYAGDVDKVRFDFPEALKGAIG